MLGTLAEVNASAARWDRNDEAAANALRARRFEAEAACAQEKDQTLRSGGWCLRRMASDRLFGHERKVHLHDGGWFKLPASHVEADKIILSGLTALAASHARIDKPRAGHVQRRQSTD